MSHFVFPDNTVLCNFAAVERLDLLETILLGRGRWTEAVSNEAERSATHLPGLAILRDQGWLGEPIQIDDVTDVAQVERIRRAVFGGKEGKPLQHLGEAQTCYIIRNWPPFAGSHWVSDDREALRYARKQGLITLETKDLIQQAVTNGQMTADDGYTFLRDMHTKRPNVRLPKSAAELHR